MSTLAPNPEQQTAIEAEGRVFLSAGAGTGKTAVLVERFVRAVCDRGIDVGSILVITYTRKAAGELRVRIRRELRERGRHDLARELDGAWIATIHGFCARLLRAYPVRGGARPALPRARRRAGVRSRRRGVRGGARRVLRPRGAGAPAAARDVRDGGAPPDADRRLRDAALGRPRARARARRAGAALRAGRLAPRGVALPRRRHERDRAPARERRGDARPPRRLAVPRPAARPLRAQGARQRAHRVVRGGAQGGRAVCARRARGSRPRPAPGAARRLRARVRRGEAARGSARLRGPAAQRARSPPLERADPRARAPALRGDHGRRVPGHEPAPVRADRPGRRRSGQAGALLRRRRVPVDLRVPARGRAGLPRATGVGGWGARARAQLPLAPRGARGGQPSVPRRVRRRLPAARGVRRVPGPRLRPPRRAADHREGDVRGHGRALAARGGEAHRAPRSRARRRGSGDAGRDRAALRCGHRRGRVRGRAARRQGCRRIARPAAGTSASSRSWISSRTCCCCRTATTTRRSSPCSRRRSSASRTTRSC